MSETSVINCKYLPPGTKGYEALAIESRAYFDLNPYPYYGFANWKTEDLGPYPRCTPIPLAIIKRFALWLFGKPIAINFPVNESCQNEIRRFWKLNKMDSKLVQMAMMGGTEGGVSIKFSYDQQKTPALRFQIISNIQYVRYFYNPLDEDDLIMVRIQFPFFDYGNGDWYWYREEITAQETVIYQPMPIKAFGRDPKNPYLLSGDPVYPNIDLEADWREQERVPNKFGVINVVKIKNWDNGSEFGQGDLFNLTRNLDRINLAYHLMDKSNQLHVDPRYAFIDLEPKDGDGTDTPIGPGGNYDLKTTDPEDGQPAKKGMIQLMEPQGTIREHIRNYANDMKEMLFDATGSVFPRQGDVTNKGSLTQSVMTQIYEPMLEVNGEKRKCYGDNGICELIRTVAMGLQTMGISPFKELGPLKSLQDDKLETSLTWFSQFEQSDDQKFAQFDRIDRETQGGYLEPEQAVKKVYQLEETSLSDEVLKQRVAEVEEQIELGKQSIRAGITATKQRGNDPNGTGSSKSEPDGGKRKQESKRKQQGAGPATKDAN